MTTEIHLSRVESEFAERDYPVACDALAALQNVLPIEAVGEPGQSDGGA